MKIAFATLLAALFLTASAAHASAILTGSGYGPEATVGTCTSGNCEAFAATSTVVDGTYDVYEFDEDGTIYDVIDVGSVTASTSAPVNIDIPVVNTDVSTTDMINGIFACGEKSGNATDGATTVQDSSFPAQTLTGLPCTADSNAYTAVITPSAETGAVQYEVESDVSDLVLFTVDGNLSTGTSTTPEPSSLALLAAGLLPLSFLAKRRWQA